MNRLTTAFFLFVALMHVAPSQAGLVRVGAEVSVSQPGDAATSLGYAVNARTGERAVCYGFLAGAVSTLKCARLGTNDALIGNWLVTSLGFLPIRAMDVALADDGRLYVALLTDPGASIRGWDIAGNALFTPIQLSSTVVWSDVDIAATANGFWVAATSQAMSFATMQFHYSAYDLSGAQTFDQSLPATGLVGFTLCPIDVLSDVAANRSGDIALTWIQRSHATAGGCIGTVMIQTFRNTLVATSQPRAISTIVTNASNADVSMNIDPRIVALDDGRFVLAWTNQAVISTATIGATGSTLVPPTVVGAGFVPAVSANPTTGDVVITRERDHCTLETQLLIEGDLDPLARFDVGSCIGVSRHRNGMETDGRLTIARARASGVTLSRVDLPAQIEVANVTLTEGNPGAGTPPQVRVDASLTRAHPNNEDVHVSYFARSGTARINEDFAQTYDTAVFASGTTASQLAVALLPDTLYEDDEGFTIELEQPVNAVLRYGAQRSNVVIRDDDATPPIGAACEPSSIVDCTVQESTAGLPVDFSLKLTMAQPVAASVQISYVTQNGTATAGTDYVAASGQVQIPAGATTAVIALRVLPDAVPENTETFRLRLSAPAGVTLPAPEIVITILDDALCALSVMPDEIVAPHTGDARTLAVATGEDCDWSVASPDDWITVTAPPVPRGDGEVAVQIAPFDPPPGVFERSGEIIVTLTGSGDVIRVPVDQDGDCSFTVAPGSQQFAVEGGTGTFTVDASVPQCAWGVTSPAPWITIQSPLAPVFGDGTVSYSIDANAAQANVEPGSRSIAFASEEFDYDVTQDGCTYALDSSTLTADAAGDVSYFSDIQTQNVCRWTAVSHASWILVQDGASGTGSGSVELFVLDNPTVQSRTGTVTIGDETLVVTQGGLECDYALGPASIAACPDGRAFTLDVTATDGCDWSLHSDAAWADVVQGDAGAGDDSAQGVIEVNLGESPRSATLQLRAQNIGVDDTEVVQEGYLTYELFDAARPLDWIYQPDAAWSAAGGDLIGVAGAGTAVALDASSSCTECEISARLALNTASSAASENLALLGWYRDADNYVSLGMDEFSNRWRLTQVVDGVRYSVEATAGQIVPNAPYDLHLVFDGASFVAELGGQPLFSTPLQGDPPSGRAGLRISASSGRLSELRTNAIEADPNPATATRIFASRFESGESSSPSLPNTSQCRLLD